MTAKPGFRRIDSAYFQHATVAADRRGGAHFSITARMNPSVVAEIEYTAFTSRKQDEQVTARLIVRRVKRLNPRHAGNEQGGLLDAYRHHAVFTDRARPDRQPRPAMDPAPAPQLGRVSHM